MQHSHPHARLTTHGRARLLHSVASGTPVADACADAGVSRTTYSHWRQRFASEGLPGLADRSSRPRCPRMALTPAQEQTITVHRTELGWGPDRIAFVLRLPRATVHRAIVRLGLRRTWSTRRNSDASSAGRDIGSPVIAGRAPAGRDRR